MINDYLKLAACIALMWTMPYCAKKAQPPKTVQADVALSVQEDCLIVAIERRLTKLEAQTYQPAKQKPTHGEIVPISASEAIHQ